MQIIYEILAWNYFGLKPVCRALFSKWNIWLRIFNRVVYLFLYKLRIPKLFYTIPLIEVYSLLCKTICCEKVLKWYWTFVVLIRKNISGDHDRNIYLNFYTTFAYKNKPFLMTLLSKY